jgi:hypothetical protein
LDEVFMGESQAGFIIEEAAVRSNAALPFALAREVI